jgi:hypothetical protein
MPGRRAPPGLPGRLGHRRHVGLSCPLGGNATERASGARGSEAAGPPSVRRVRAASPGPLVRADAGSLRFETICGIRGTGGARLRRTVRQEVPPPRLRPRCVRTAFGPFTKDVGTRHRGRPSFGSVRGKAVRAAPGLWSVTTGRGIPPTALPPLSSGRRDVSESPVTILVPRKASSCTSTWSWTAVRRAVSAVHRDPHARLFGFGRGYLGEDVGAGARAGSPPRQGSRTTYGLDEGRVVAVRRFEVLTRRGLRDLRAGLFRSHPSPSASGLPPAVGRAILSHDVFRPGQAPIFLFL